MPTYNRVNKYVADFSAAWMPLGEKVAADIAKRITPETSVHDIMAILQRVFIVNKITEKTQRLVIDGMIKSLQYGAGSPDGVGIRAWFLDRAYAGAPVLSREIVAKMNAPEVAITIQRALGSVQGWRTAAQQLTDKALVKSNVAEDVVEIERLARNAYRISGDAEGYQQFKTLLHSTQARINRLVNPSTSKLKRAYQDILDASENASAKVLDSAIEEAIIFKARSNAERIATTEMSKAYGDGFFSEILADEDVIGWRSVLSTAHVDYDICDFWASVDMYGMGAGRYPKDQGPPYPYHPYCTCKLSPVFGMEKPQAQEDKKAVQKQIERLPQEKRIVLLGVSGNNDFSSGAASWEGVLKNYHGVETKTAKIPVSVLHGN
jgi:hypothetical protein